MSVKGIRQLKSVRLYFCDFGGSSRGTRRLLQSDTLVDYMKANKFKLDIFMRRGKHPYFSAAYINGYVKDVPLRNLEEEKVIEMINRAYISMGRRPIRHNIQEVSKDNISIQGRWHDDLWNKFPKHEMEKKRRIPEFTEEYYPDIRREDKFRDVPHHLKVSRKREDYMYPAN